MSGGGQAPVTTTAQTNTPWAPVANQMSSDIGQAAKLFNAGIGYQPYEGQTVADLDPSMALGLNQMQAVASAQQAPGGANDMLSNAMQQGNNLISNQGITPGIQGAISGLGQVGNQYSNIYNQGGALMQAQNPYLQQMLQSTIGNQINSSMSGAGRYGSGAQQEAIAAGESPALAQDWQARQQMGLGAEQGATQGLGATNQATADIYGQGLNRAGQWAQMMPQMMQAQYLPSQMQGQAGQYLQNRAQQQLQGQISLYNAQQAWPWEELSRLNAITGGAGGMGGTSVGTQSTQVPIGQRLLGGALAGGGLGGAIGGPFGAAGGAGLGALAGGFL